MTRDEARRAMFFAKREVMADSYIDKAYDMAIKALEEPERTGRCMWCDGIEDRRLRIEFYWIDDDGNTASFSEPHMVATGIAKYCPECGRKLGGGA